MQLLCHGCVVILGKEVGSRGRGTVAKLITFYVPSSYRKNVKWVPAEDRGKVIEIPRIKKSA